MNVTVEALEKQLEDQKGIIETQERALRLANNRDFKKLILEGFCVEECARYAQLSADPSLSAENRADALGMAQAAGHLRRWLQVINAMGNAAKNQVAELNEAIDEARLMEDQPDSDEE